MRTVSLTWRSRPAEASSCAKCRGAAGANWSLTSTYESDGFSVKLLRKLLHQSCALPRGASLDLAQRSGETLILSQIHNEADGFDQRRAGSLDEELNIRDQQGKVRDYIDFFQSTGLTEAEANDRGFLQRATGKRAFAIANDGDPDLFAAHRSGGVSDEAAFAIPTAAPKDGRLQAVSIRAVLDGKPIVQAANIMRAVKMMAGEREDTTVEMLGIDTEAIREDAARTTQGQSQDDYERAVQADLRQAIAQTGADAARRDARSAGTSREDRGEAAGNQGREADAKRPSQKRATPAEIPGIAAQDLAEVPTARTFKTAGGALVWAAQNRIALPAPAKCRRRPCRAEQPIPA